MTQNLKNITHKIPSAHKTLAFMFISIFQTNHSEILKIDLRYRFNFVNEINCVSDQL